jgi:TRAP transporter 4TM/12TM fusion protein
MSTTSTNALSQLPADLDELEAEHDPEMQFRPLLPRAAWLVAALLFTLSCFHYYTAGFGLLPEVIHRGIHVAFVLGLIFLVFPARRDKSARPPHSGLLRPLDIGLPDWLLAIAAALASLYVPWVFHDLQFRVGNPDPLDWIMGTLMIIVVLEATRRSVGPALSIIAIVLVIYALLGPSLPGIFAHPGNTWKSVVNHLYLTVNGVYGIALGVVATYVFHYVLFGVLATRVGLGRFFIDIATAIAGRFAGGPAKVSIFASGLFGMISGSSIANTVTVGSLTIPMMIRIGYPRHFAGAVESTAATGGQITPPIMGAAAFLMVEYLSIPYQTIIIAAITPACMHFVGVFCQVHFEAKKRGMRGMTAADLPRIGDVVRRDWPTFNSPARTAGRPVLGFHPLPRGVLGHHRVHPYRSQQSQPDRCRRHAGRGGGGRACRTAQRMAGRRRHSQCQRRGVGVVRCQGHRRPRAPTRCSRRLRHGR